VAATAELATSSAAVTFSGASMASVPPTHVTAVESALASSEARRPHSPSRRKEEQGGEGDDGEPCR
jgi:hypothetical protein